MPNAKEIEEVLKLDAEKRFRYTIKRIADWQFAWVIGDEKGFAIYGDDVWP